jgi:hypothetical protein
VEEATKFPQRISRLHIVVQEAIIKKTNMYKIASKKRKQFSEVIKPFILLEGK